MSTASLHSCVVNDSPAVPRDHFSDAELRALGLASVGIGVRLSRRASLHGLSRIALGDHCRIDDFCVLSAGSGGIRIGRYVHVACHATLIGDGPIELDDFSGLSGRVSIYSSSDDYSGVHLTNPTVPERYTRVRTAAVRIGRHAIVGAGTVVMPGANVAEGCAVGALALVVRRTTPWGVYAGAPARRVRERRRDLLALEAELWAGYSAAHSGGQPASEESLPSAVAAPLY